MKKGLKILLNAVLCIVHGLCLLLLEDFLSITLIWADVGFSLNGRILGCALLDLVVHYLVFIQLSKRGVACKFTLPALRCIDYVICGVFCLLWIGLYLYVSLDDMMFPWTECLQVAFVVGMNAAVILVRKFICPRVIRIAPAAPRIL